MVEAVHSGQVGQSSSYIGSDLSSMDHQYLSLALPADQSIPDLFVRFSVSLSLSLMRWLFQYKPDSLVFGPEGLTSNGLKGGSTIRANSSSVCDQSKKQCV